MCVKKKNEYCNIENFLILSTHMHNIQNITLTIKIPNSYLQNVRSFWTEGYKNPCFRNQRKHFKDHSPELLQCVPYFFVIGFPKCGTTDLFDRLSHHPEFIKPAFKEIHWISRYRFIPPRTDRLKFIAMNRTYRK